MTVIWRLIFREILSVLNGSLLLLLLSLSLSLLLILILSLARPLPLFYLNVNGLCDVKAKIVLKW